MAEKMKQLVLMDKGLQGKGGKWEMREVDIPHPGPNQLLVLSLIHIYCSWQRARN